MTSEVEEINLTDDELNLQHIRKKPSISEPEPKIMTYSSEENERSENLSSDEVEEDEDDERKSDLIDHILSYKKEPEFSEMLSDIPEHLSHYNIEQLMKMLKQIKKRLSRQSPMVEQGVFMVCSVIEKLGTSKGFYLQGYTNMMRLNPIATRAIKELSIDYSHKTSLSPEQRLMGVAITSALSLHSVGSAKAQMREMMKLDEPMDEEVVKNFNE